jgi:hypothetical protein
VTGKREVADRLAGHLEALGEIPEGMLENDVVQEVRSTVSALRVCKDWTEMRKGNVDLVGADELNRVITREKLHPIISKLKWYKAAGLDKVRSAVLVCLAAESSEFMERTVEVFQSMFEPGEVPELEESSSIHAV